MLEEKALPAVGEGGRLRIDPGVGATPGSEVELARLPGARPAARWSTSAAIASRGSSRLKNSDLVKARAGRGSSPAGPSPTARRRERAPRDSAWLRCTAVARWRPMSDPLLRGRPAHRASARSRPSRRGSLRTASWSEAARVGGDVQEQAGGQLVGSGGRPRLPDLEQPGRLRVRPEEPEAGQRPAREPF